MQVSALAGLLDVAEVQTPVVGLQCPMHSSGVVVLPQASPSAFFAWQSPAASQ